MADLTDPTGGLVGTDRRRTVNLRGEYIYWLEVYANSLQMTFKQALERLLVEQLVNNGYPVEYNGVLRSK